MRDRCINSYTQRCSSWPHSGLRRRTCPNAARCGAATRQYNKGNYEKSIERYERALEAAPESFEATYNLGNALYKAERFDKAEQTMRRAAADSLRTDEERAEAFYNLGNAQFKQQKYKEALESYKQSLRLNPADQQAKVQLRLHQAPDRRQRGRRRWRRRRQEPGQRPEPGSAATGQRTGQTGRRPAAGRQGPKGR